MNITCPHCSFSREIDDARIPEGTLRVACPRCKEKFSFSREAALEPDLAPPAIDRLNAPAPVAEEAIAAPAPPVYHVSAPQMPAAVDLPKAGFWIRVAASIIDSILVTVMQMVISSVLFLATGLASGGLSDEGHSVLFGATWLFSILLTVAYYVTFTGYNGQTPGKMLVRIKVIRTDGTEIGYGKAALRETVGKFASGIIFGIGYLMVAFDARKQGLHDKIADTYVIKI
jgi:predicted Zn finger-like uncharacterized protein